MVLAAMFCMNGCCSWIPLLFFLGAGNILQTCENYDPWSWHAKESFVARSGREDPTQLVPTLLGKQVLAN